MFTDTAVSRVWYEHASKFFQNEREGHRANFKKGRELSKADLNMLTKLLEGSDEPDQIVVFHPRTGERQVHQYGQVAALGAQPLLDAERAERVLLEQFQRFPSLTPTKLAASKRSAVLNFGDHVKLSRVRVLRHEGYQIFLIEALTREPHALAGQLNHMLFQHLSTGRSYLVRVGVGHLLGLNTPGAGVLDHFNDVVGAYSWVLASRFARAALSGDDLAIERLERTHGLRLARLLFTVGGVASRHVIQPIQRFTYSRTAETVFGAYLIALLVIFFGLLAYVSEEEEGAEPKDGPEMS